jgi:hypothetical protein
VETTNPYFYILSDIFVTPARPDLLDATLDALFIWCARSGALTINFNTTTGGQPPKLMEVFLRRMHMHPLARFRQPLPFPYYLTPKGKESLGVPMPR